MIKLKNINHYYSTVVVVPQNTLQKKRTKKGEFNVILSTVS